MKAKKIDWYYDEFMKEYKSDDFGYIIWEGTEYSLFRGSENLGFFNSLEEAQEAAQKDASKRIAESIDPNYLQELVAFALFEVRTEKSPLEVIEEFNNKIQ